MKHLSFTGIVVVLMLLLILPVSALPANTSGSDPLTITFTDTSTDYPTSWNYTARDVTGANITYSIGITQNFTYIFHGGNWSIRLTTCSAFGCNTTADNAVFINVTGAATPPVANFTTASWTVYNGVPTQFTDTSTNSPTSWEWRTGPHDIGTSVVSTEQNPMLTFSSATYTSWDVVLKATNSAGTDTETKYVSVVAAPSAPVANFTPTGTYESGRYVIHIQNNTLLNFTSTSTGGTPTNTSWVYQDNL